MRFLLVCFFLLFSLSPYAQKYTGAFNLAVEWKGNKYKEARLYYTQAPNAPEEGMEVLAEKSGDMFHFKGQMLEPGDVYISFFLEYVKNGQPKRDTVDFSFFLSPGISQIIFDGNVFKYSVIGPKGMEDQKELRRRANKDRFAIVMMENKLARSDMPKQQIRRHIDSMKRSSLENIYLVYIKEHPASEFALNALYNLMPLAQDSPSKYLAVLNTLPRAVHKLPGAVKVRRNLEGLQRAYIGADFPLQAQWDTSGHKITIADLRGKIVLVDFWASWCAPCRAGHPELVNTFNKFKDRNFIIYSVALERKGDLVVWKKAIQKDGLTWMHGTDFKSWQNALSSSLGIASIPYNMLLDANGRIIAKDLHGKALEEKLEALLHKSESAGQEP